GDRNRARKCKVESEVKRLHFRASRTWKSSARVEILWLFRRAQRWDVYSKVIL
ncbi:hypothetical protein ASPCADRAFT_207817, partial [Aspergillus carbonarius ITEM 5010]